MPWVAQGSVQVFGSQDGKGEYGHTPPDELTELTRLIPESPEYIVDPRREGMSRLARLVLQLGAQPVS